MSCNPSIGGIGKGHLVREIDALGGVMGVVADRAAIQFRMLNRSRGPAVQGPRAQMDRDIYKKEMQSTLLSLAPNLEICTRGGVEDLLLLNKADHNSRSGLRVGGVRLDTGEEITSDSVVLTTGTFLRGMIHIGKTKTPAGRVGDAPSVGLAKTLENFGFALGRLKTGTPPRIARDSIDYSLTEEQRGDDPPTPFSFIHEAEGGIVLPREQVGCVDSFSFDCFILIYTISSTVIHVKLVLKDGALLPQRY